LVNYLTEIARVLRPNGVCCLSTLNLSHNHKPGRPYQKLVYHEKEFTAPELRACVAQVFPSVELFGLHPTAAHALMERLKKWGLSRLGPPSLNPVARFYQRVTPRDFVVSHDVSPQALDLIALCRQSMSDQPSAVSDQQGKDPAGSSRA
jgi:hypothetical protein